jgi:alpha-glucuronidase
MALLHRLFGLRGSTAPPLVLYGAFHFLRLLQTHSSITKLQVSSAPKIQRGYVPGSPE